MHRSIILLSLLLPILFLSVPATYKHPTNRIPTRKVPTNTTILGPDADYDSDFGHP